MLIWGGNSKISGWIDQCQYKFVRPVAELVAKFARVPLIETRQMLEAGSENKLLMVVMGPFRFEHDTHYSWWEGFKVIIHNREMVAAICRLNSSGSGGFYHLKTWDCYKHSYVYHGDPSAERQLRPQGIVRITCEYLASQHHVGFVEDDSAAVQTAQASQITEEEITRWKNRT